MKPLALLAGLMTLSAVGSMNIASSTDLPVNMVGSWSATGVGGQVSVGQQTLVSRPLSPPEPLPASARVTQLNWRITLLSTPPPGLQISLCTQSVCFALQGLSGARQMSASLPADQTFHFVYLVASRGPLMPALQVVSNQLTVNYGQ
ncbi:flagellar protein FlhE [Pantoea vagans]|uniref:flagellar protein FlhE n=1 Tax=Pantoea vagans TaxID=470934 RepID=UPI003FA39B37